MLGKRVDVMVFKRGMIVVGLALLVLVVPACAPDQSVEPATLTTIRFSLGLDGDTIAAQGVPAGSSSILAAVRVYRTTDLLDYLDSLVGDSALPEPAYSVEDPHPIFGANVPRRLRFNAERVESELGGTTLFLFPPSEPLQLSFRYAGDDLADLTLVATLFDAATGTPVGPEGYPTAPALAYGSVSLPFATSSSSVNTDVRIPVRSFLSSASLQPRIPIEAVFPEREYDFTLNVSLNGRAVPSDDYAATYSTIMNASLAPSFSNTPAERARGVRVLTVAESILGSPRILMVEVLVAGIQTAGSPAVFYRGVSFTDTVSIDFGGNGFTFDVEPPHLTIDSLSDDVLSGTVSDTDGSGVDRVQVFDGPRLIASSANEVPPSSVIVINGDTWSAPLSALDAATGDAYRITVVATDGAGNFTRLSVVVDLTEETITPSNPPELP